MENVDLSRLKSLVGLGSAALNVTFFVWAARYEVFSRNSKSSAALLFCLFAFAHLLAALDHVCFTQHMVHVNVNEILCAKAK